VSKFDEIERVLFDYPAMRVNLEALQDAADSYDCSYDRVRVSGGDETSRVEKLAVKRADYGRYVSLVEAIMAILPGIERQFIQHRYFQGMQVEDIAEIFHVDVRSVYNIKTRALGTFVVALGWGKKHPAFERPAQVQGTLFSA
jgi:DNA-directed RNA polymerase specialized sigma subunit